MTVFQIVILTLLIALCSSETSKEKRFNILKKKAGKSNTGLISTLTKSEFKKTIASGPRQYGILLFLTVLGPGSTCKVCGQVHDATVDLSKELAYVRNAHPDQDNKQVFVIEIDYTAHQSIISELGLDRVPQVVFIPHTKSSRSVALADLFDSLGSKYSYSMMMGYKVQNFLDFVNKVGKLDLDTSRPVGSFEILLFCVVIVVAVIMIIASWSIIDMLRRRMILYALVGTAFYCFCVGGGMYSIIRNSAWSGGTKKKPEWFMKQGRNQYGIETYCVGLAQLIAGGAVFLFVMSNKFATREDKFKDTPTAVKWVFQYIPSVIPAAVIAAGWYVLISLYNTKSPSYSMGLVGMRG